MKGKAQVTREKKREKNQEKEGLQDRGALYLMYAGPASPVDDDGDGSTSRPCSSLELYAGVVSRSTDTPVGSRTRIR